jgi:hypothetical protein
MNTSPTDPPNLDAELSRVQRRTLQYWFEDGLVELAIGSSFLLLSSWIATMSLLPTSVAGKLGAGFPVAYILIFLACRRVIRRAKEGLVYPRTGYVSYARPSPRRRLLSQLAGAIVAALVVLLVRKAPPIEAWIPAANGLFIAVLLFLMNRSAKLPRLSLLAGIAAVTGLLLSVRGGQTDQTIAALFAVIGLVMTAGGALALRRYLRQAPPPEGA